MSPNPVAASGELLRARSVVVSYGAVKALQSASLEVREAEIVCLLGSNGAGKTTFVRAAMGLVPLQSGSFTWRGRDLAAVPAHGRTPLGISWVPEGRGVFARMTVEDNLLMGAYSHGNRAQARRDMQEVLELFPKLRARHAQAASTLSGGEQQMLALGRALMTRPTLILLDEPSMGLAPVMVDQVFDVIASIHRRGVSVLLIEQNAHVALALSSRYYVLQKGLVVIQGDVVEGRLRSHTGGSARPIEADELETAYLGG